MGNMLHVLSQLKQVSDKKVSVGKMNMQKKARLMGEDPDAGKDWGQEEKGVAEDEMVRWHHWFNGHEFEQAAGDNEGQGSLLLLLSHFSRVWLCATP